MKNFRIVSLVALVAVGLYGGLTVAQAAGGAGAGACVQSQPGVEAKIRALLHKNAHGGNALTLAIQSLLQKDPCAIAAIIYAATNQANAEQALSLAQGVAQALALLQSSNPSGAQIVQNYLKDNSTNPVVAQIQTAEIALGSVGGGGGGGNAAGGGSGGGSGGGFVGGGGISVSVH